MWVAEKIRVSVERTNLSLPTGEYTFRFGDTMFGEKSSSEKSKMISIYPNIITPDTIPEFCIPPKITPHQGQRRSESVRLGLGNKDSSGDETIAWDLLSSHIIQVEAADDTPVENGFSDEGTTNADPQSQAALSLPHLAKAHTCYGFCTLLESPHTRRKESLFHSDPSICGLPLISPRGSASIHSLARPVSPSTSAKHSSLSSRLSLRALSLGRQGTPDSDTTSSAESSPFSSPLLTRPVLRAPLLNTLSHDRLPCRGTRRHTASRNDSLSTDEGSSTDNSPSILRRASEGPARRSIGLAPPIIFPTDLALYRDRIMRESRLPLGQSGALRLSAEHCPENQQLRVRVISAEGLYSSLVDPRSISCGVSLSLLPGKVQKQRSTVIRKSRNPVFNEDFFFDGVSEQDLCCRSLRFKVVNKMCTMKRDYVLGECEVLLSRILTLS